MATNSVYLNYTGQAEEAFNFYKSVFGTEFIGGIMRHGDVPAMEGMPALDDATKQMVMNVQLPITGGLTIMASDIFPGMGDPIVPGNNFSIGVHPDTREEADRIFAEPLRRRQGNPGHGRSVLGRLLRQLQRQVRHPLVRGGFCPALGSS